MAPWLPSNRALPLNESVDDFMANANQTLRSEGQSALAKAASSPGAVTRVLAVDDEPAACKLLSVILGPPAFHCTTANSGE